MCETWKLSDINDYKYESNKHGRPPIQDERTVGIHGRNSGGVYIGSNLPANKLKQRLGMCKARINGIYFISIYTMVLMLMNFLISIMTKEFDRVEEQRKMIMDSQILDMMEEFLVSDIGKNSAT